MDQTFDKLQSAGAAFVHEVTAQPWCQLTVRFLDPDGHMIEVGERMDVCVKRAGLIRDVGGWNCSIHHHAARDCDAYAWHG